MNKRRANFRHDAWLYCQGEIILELMLAMSAESMLLLLQTTNQTVKFSTYVLLGEKAR
jgi:hypothetical protein